RGRGQRQGFTLVEIMIVITIIAVMAALLLAGGSAVQRKLKQTKTQYEITKVDQSLKGAESKYQGTPKVLPGRLLLYNNVAIYGNTPQQARMNYPGIVQAADVTPLAGPNDFTRSAAVLRSMFGTRLIPPYDPKNPSQLVAWDGARTGTG